MAPLSFLDTCTYMYVRTYVQYVDRLQLDMAKQSGQSICMHTVEPPYYGHPRSGSHEVS